MDSASSSMPALEKEIAIKVGRERGEEEEKSIYVNFWAPASDNPARYYSTTNCWYVIRSSGRTSEMSRVFEKKPPHNPDSGLRYSNCVLVGSSTLYLIGGLEPYLERCSDVVRYLDVKSSDDSAGWKTFRVLPFPCSEAISAASGPWIYVIFGAVDDICEERKPWGYIFHTEKINMAYFLYAPPDASSIYPYAMVGYKGGILVQMPKENRLYFHDPLTDEWSLYHDGDVVYHGYEYPDAFVLSDDDVLYFYYSGDVPRLCAFDLVQRKRFPPVDLPSALCFSEDINVHLVAVAKDKFCMLRGVGELSYYGIAVWYTKFSVSRDDSSLQVVVEEDQSFLVEAHSIVNCAAV